jgi:hypothetical protein
VNKTRLSGLILIQRAIGGCLNLLDKMNISIERSDDELREIQNGFKRAKIATNNAIHTYNNKNNKEK